MTTGKNKIILPLDRTITELEHALKKWDNIEPDPEVDPAMHTELRRRTQELLQQLRQQISELSEPS